MSRLRTLWLRIRALAFGSRMEADLNDELRAHLEMLAADAARRGLSPEEAKREAALSLGGVEQTKELCREQRSLPLVETFAKDARYAVRSLLRNPAYTLAAALTLAVGIGATTAIFTFADLALTRPIALPGLERLAAIVERTPPSGDDESLSPANFLDLKAASESFEQLAAYRYWSAAVTSRDEPQQIEGVRVTAGFFAALGVEPALGRVFLPEEEEPGRDRVVILGDSLWRRRFGADASILGSKLRLDGEPYTVIGVMPGTFRFPLGARNFWAPLALRPAEKAERTEPSLRVFGRLKPGSPLEQARADIETRWRGLEKQYAVSNAGHMATVVELRRFIVRSDERQFILFLLGVTGFVLLIACANVANLQLARAAGRGREITLRAVLGAGRGRIVRQLLTESVVLSTAGAALGLLLAAWGVSVLRTTMPAEISSICDLEHLTLDWRALTLALSLAVAAGFLSGIVPALQYSRSQLNEALKEGGGRTAAGQGSRTRNVFVVAEIALALVLLTGASLMVKGFVSLASGSRELEPQRLLTFSLALPQSIYPEPHQLTEFYERALEKIAQLPQAQSTAAVSGLPYSFYDNPVRVTVEGRPAVSPDRLPSAMLESVSGGYFRTMHIALVEGREFDARDKQGSALVAIVSESMARRLWPGERAVGKRIRTEAQGEWITVEGVAADTRHEVYDRSFRSVLYRPFGQEPAQAMDFAIRTAGDPAQIARAARAAIRQIDANRPVEQVETMEQKIRGQSAALRYVAALMGAFGLAALILAAVGVYGLMAYSAAKRRHEIGVRMALGARPRDVLASVMLRGMALAGIGLALGTPVALALAQLLASLIYGVSTWDATAFVGVPAMLAAVALLASYIPARRVAREDPLAALRYE